MIELPTEIGTNEIPGVFGNFVRLVGDRHWTKRAKQLRSEIKGNPFLRDFLADENSIVFALDHCTRFMRKNGGFPREKTVDHQIYPAISFAAQVCAIANDVDTQARRRLIQRIRGALQNHPEDLRSFCLELTATTHFGRLGCSVEWPEMDGSGRFDLFVPSLSERGLEVECKSFSENKGRKVHRREAREFCSLLDKEIGESLRSLKTGLYAVLTVDNRLPTEFVKRREMAKRVAAQLVLGNSQRYDAADVRVGQFDCTNEITFGPNGEPTPDQEAIERITSTNNREVMIRGNRKGMLIFVVQSRKNDMMLEYVMRTLRESAHKQFTGHRPAWLIAEFDGIGSEDLHEVADQDLTGGMPTPLRREASAFLAGSNRGHVVGISFLSRSALVPIGGGIFSVRGSAYVFPNKESALWSEDFEGLFGSRMDS